MTSGERTCERVVSSEPEGGRLQRTCFACGNVARLHPVRICADCSHRVEFHGHDVPGCGCLTAAGWCGCRAEFGRARATRG